jgi:hypothetical protein
MNVVCEEFLGARCTGHKKFSGDFTGRNFADVRSRCAEKAVDTPVPAPTKRGAFRRFRHWQHCSTETLPGFPPRKKQGNSIAGPQPVPMRVQRRKRPLHKAPPVGERQVNRRFLSPPSPQKACSCSSVVEHFLGKEEVAGSIPATSSSYLPQYIQPANQLTNYITSWLKTSSSATNPT